MSKPSNNEAMRRLSRVLWIERIKKVATVLAICVAVAVPLVLLAEYRTEHADRSVAMTQITGVVKLSRPAGGRNTYRVSVQLDDGRNVEATSVAIAPLKGEHVILNDTEFASGQHLYAVSKVVH